MKGRKRHIVTGVMGSLPAVVVRAADIHDTKSGINPARQAFERYPAIKRLCADEGYRKTFEMEAARVLGLGVDISKRIKPEREILPKRWVVEGAFAWLNGFRRLSKDYEVTISSEETNVIIAHANVLLRRL
jgi:transposase